MDANYCISFQIPEISNCQICIPSSKQTDCHNKSSCTNPKRTSLSKRYAAQYQVHIFQQQIVKPATYNPDSYQKTTNPVTKPSGNNNKTTNRTTI